MTYVLFRDGTECKLMDVLHVIENFKPDQKKSLKDYLTEFNEQVPKINQIVEECSRWLESTSNERRTYNLNEQEILAIGLFTWDLGLNGNQEDNFYFQLNETLLQRSPANIKKWIPYLFYLQSALNKIPKQRKEVYQGIPFRDLFLEEIKKITQ